MPGPPLSATFTYDGTPGYDLKTDKPNTLDRETVQSNRFFQNIQLGTHSRTPTKADIPRNSDRGKGVGGGTTVQDKHTA